MAVRRRAKTPSLGAEANDYYYESDGDSGSNWEFYLMVLIMLLAGGALLFSIMGWHESKQASDFAYNAEAYAKHHKLRDDARRTCDPLFSAIAEADITAAVLISDFINQNLSPEDHRALCLSLVSPSPPPPLVIFSDQEPADDLAADEAPVDHTSLSEEFCAKLAGFPFDDVCAEQHELLLNRAICSCAPTGEE